MPKLNPVPTNEPPPETDPRHVSSPAAAKPGAKAVGTFLSVCLAGTLLLLMIVAVPPCPEIACDVDVDPAMPTPVPRRRR